MNPGEIHNLWGDPGCADLKARLITKLLFAEMGKEPLWMPRTWGGVNRKVQSAKCKSQGSEVRGRKKQ